MKRIFSWLVGYFCLLGIYACGQDGDVRPLKDDEIYFFYQTSCPHCHEAAQYIKKEYPELKMVARDISLPGNMKLYVQAVRYYGIIGSAGTPLICFGPKYIMGWGDQNRQLFDLYVQPYLKK